jgi:5-hydroxyisourate hydrolase
LGKLTTHILDTALGCPARDIRIELLRVEGQMREKISETRTNDDGRCDAPILEGGAFKAGVYELVFHVGTYLDSQGIDLPEPKFLDEIVIRFGISDLEQHYHVPLLLSPFSYATYKGS